MRITPQMRALWHPLRAEIYKVMLRGPATLSQIADSVKRPVDNVAYHSALLCKAECIHEVEGAGFDATDPLYEITVS